MDFTPRDGEIAIGGIPWLARMIDKARAKANGTLGEYIYPCPKDKQLLQKLNLTGDQFLAIVTSSNDDAEILKLVQNQGS